jgi:hypothetical protein
MKKKEHKPIYWEIPVMAIILFIAHIAVYILFFMYLTGVEL